MLADFCEFANFPIDRICEQRKSILQDVQARLIALYAQAISTMSCLHGRKICQATKIGLIALHYQALNLSPTSTSMSLVWNSIANYFKSIKDIEAKFSDYKNYPPGRHPCHYVSCMSPVYPDKVFGIYIDKYTAPGFREKWQKVTLFNLSERSS